MQPLCFSAVTHTDFFTLFGLTPAFQLDAGALDAAFRQVQSQVHPDRFANGTAAEKRIAMQWATRANEAYQTLRSPLKRAAYLCEQHGVPIDAESNTAMPAAFLMQQMTWREALDEARDGQGDGLAALLREVGDARDEIMTALGDALDARRDFPQAAALVRQLMFVEKFMQELQTAAATGEAAGH